MVAPVIDCHSKMVACYALADHLRASLCGDAITMAARTVTIVPEAIFHSEVFEEQLSSIQPAGRCCNDRLNSPSTRRRNSGNSCRA